MQLCCYLALELLGAYWVQLCCYLALELVRLLVYRLLLCCEADGLLELVGA